MSDNDGPDNDGDSHRQPSRRRFVAGTTAALTVATAGCVSAGLTVETDGVDESDVFESVSLMESWAASTAAATVTLTDAAVKEQHVRELSVIDPKGSSVWAGDLDPGQRSVSNALFPVGKPARLVAADGSKKFVAEVTVRVFGSSIP